MKKTLMSAAIAAALAAGSYAATDGTLGTSSTGTLDLTIRYEPVIDPVANIQITGLDDIDFGTLENGIAGPQSIGAICVFMDLPGTYAVDIAGEAMEGDVASDIIGLGSEIEFVNYQFAFADDAGQSVSGETTSGDTADGIADPTITVSEGGFTPSSEAGCASGVLASLTVTPTNAGRTGITLNPTTGITDQPTATNYSGSISITVTPE